MLLLLLLLFLFNRRMHQRVLILHYRYHPRHRQHRQHQHQHRHRRRQQQRLHRMQRRQRITKKAIEVYFDRKQGLIWIEFFKKNNSLNWHYFENSESKSATTLHKNAEIERFKWNCNLYQILNAYIMFSSYALTNAAVDVDGLPIASSTSLSLLSSSSTLLRTSSSSLSSQSAQVLFSNHCCYWLLIYSWF